MRYSVTMVATDASPPIGDVARAVEERGFDGLWLPDHTHIPISRQTAYPLGGELPERYKRLLDPFVALAVAAASTTTLGIGTGILVACQRDPIVTAKALATLDHISGGRVRAGIGFGWNLEEMVDHGVDPASRRGRTREHILAMRRLWEDDEAAFDGVHVTLPPAWQWPKPVQRPLPILVGGAATDTVFGHIAEYAQGWIPMGTRGLSAAIPRLRERLAAVGRDSSDLQIVSFTSAAANNAALDHLEDVGATECAFELPSDIASGFFPVLDRLATLVAERGRNPRCVHGARPESVLNQEVPLHDR